jgi:hypothetical protein
MSARCHHHRSQGLRNVLILQPQDVIHTQLSLHIIQPTNLLGESPLESIGVGVELL